MRENQHQPLLGAYQTIVNPFCWEARLFLSALTVNFPTSVSRQTGPTKVASRALLANSKLSWNSPSLKASNWLTSSLDILGCRNRIPTVGKPSGQFVPSISYLLGILSGGSHRDAPIVHKGFAQNLEFPYAYLQYLIRAGSELGTTNWMLKNTYYWFKMSQKTCSSKVQLKRNWPPAMFFDGVISDSYGISSSYHPKSPAKLTQLPAALRWRPVQRGAVPIAWPARSALAPAPRCPDGWWIDSWNLIKSIPGALKNVATYS